VLSGVGFILTGSAGVFAGVVLSRRKSMVIRTIGALVLAAAAAIWALTGYMGYWGHMAAFKDWVPK
jgi:putative membrane protein